jgi:ArsR family transcriptional regulator
VLETTTTLDVFDRLTALAEPVRARILLLLEAQELTVSELREVLQAPQSTVSRHLKALADGGWVASRPEGTRRYYRVDRDRLEAPIRRLWMAVREQVAAAAGTVQDRARLAPVLARRRSRSAAFFSSEAGDWDRMRDELFGPGFFLQALPGLLDPGWVVGDLGCGSGAVAAALAPFVGRVIAVDGAEEMLREARARLRPHINVEVLHGELEALPVDDGALDAAVLALVLHHVPEPARALREVARVLRGDGRLLIVDMRPHDREDLAARMGHVWLGFTEEALRGYLLEAGFEAVRLAPLPVNPAARGPALIAAAARRQQNTATR